MTRALLHINRVLLGLIFLIAGVNGYFVIVGLDPFIETSPEAMDMFTSGPFDVIPDHCEHILTSFVC
ncbi:hypothetical protein [Fictibacillus sp. NRS-1165]|uniref:hypothetical protein n=1 Tax=Fictibacillus sp. NRS-1165 TaxID=3144463 RepID=UPI003D1D8211